MQPDVKRLSEQSQAFWKRLNLVRRVLLVSVLVLTLGGLYFVTLPKSVEFGVLYSGLSTDDAAKVTAALEASKVPFQLKAGGATVEVPVERVDGLRIELAGKGLPQGGGVGFELFDQQSFSTTSFVEKLNYHRALSGELSRTLTAIEGVDKARVHIAVPERSLYRREDAPPSVSVALKLKPGRQLSPGQVRGIVHLVTTSVAKLSPDRVSVVDESGNILWSGDESHGVASAQRDLEATLQRRVSDILDRLVGPGQSVVVVTAEMDTARQERTEELYDKEGALRSESKSEERRFQESERTGGVSGVSANLLENTPAPIAEDPSAPDQKPRSSRTSETRNFEVNRIVTRTEGPKVKVRRLHIAVLINGIAPTETSTLTAMIGTREPGARVPSPADLTRVAALVREAAGLDPSRGDRLEVQSLPFAALEPALGEVVSAADASSSSHWASKPPMLIAGGAIGLVLIALLAVVLLRGRGSSEYIPQLSSPITASELEAKLSENPGYRLSPADLRELSVRERVQLAAKHDSAAAARILSSWVREKESSRMGGN